ncbi:Pimeloyl-ACP methyl ester carboxylesterase [Streptomyces sp. DvalAA-14]|uniref:epoxide hydrolase family protein n=1 Tax=unclassified Streptomyces TaxID=2593676 RepID=UPI00081B4E88|nr:MULTISPECIES: epoxide hydrolase family protein [unclassified Streptomyces]MYS23656.1 alpha/beta fold hydrolase [Streptomyces sp. SID4948]SCE36716.1 Pimeloyl-ACP methyl ester carboxylesterase [Streptomyces sp. DvalAA-14]
MIEPFRIDIPQADLDDLADRLSRTRWPNEVADAGRDYGFPLARLQELAERWRTGYDWREHEAALNELPHFTTEIDGQTIHFVHVRSAKPDALALILTHGWPGSFLEFLDVIEPLSRDFHLVIPSIPGYGFSGPTHERGWDITRVARAWAELMRRLGYHRYGAQGGDFGAGISTALGAAAPGQVIGVHVNYLPTRPVPDAGIELSATDEARLDKIRQLMENRPPYQSLQAATPQTIGYALTDSPVGQLVWIAERFAQWTDPRSPISDDRILTDVSLYWLTATAASSARLHHDSPRRTEPCPVPVGVAVFAHDITQSVRPLAERLYDIRHWSEFERGGHFAAMEVPELLAEDVRDFFLARIKEEAVGVG